AALDRKGTSAQGGGRTAGIEGNQVLIGQTDQPGDLLRRLRLHHQLRQILPEGGVKAVGVPVAQSGQDSVPRKNRLDFPKDFRIHPQTSSKRISEQGPGRKPRGVNPLPTLEPAETSREKPEGGANRFPPRAVAFQSMSSGNRGLRAGSPHRKSRTGRSDKPVGGFPCEGWRSNALRRAFLMGGTAFPG